MAEIREQAVEVNVSKPAEDLTLTKEELKAVLDAKIRREVRWAVKSAEASSFHENNEPLIQKVAARIYDSIVGDLTFNKDMLKATRAVKFSADYVAKAIRGGLSSGVISLTEADAREVETILSSEDVEARIQGITNLVARESLRG